MGNLNILKERKPQACLNRYSFAAGCHTRWRGLESHLMKGEGMALDKDMSPLGQGNDVYLNCSSNYHYSYSLA